MAEAITGSYNANKLVIGYLAVGNDDTAPASTDTGLTGQVGALKEYIVGSLHNETESNVGQASWFFESTEATYYDTWKEIGMYAANGTTLLTHALISPTKTFNVTKTMNVLYEVEF